MKKVLLIAILTFAGLGLLGIGPCALLEINELAGGIDFCAIIKCDGTNPLWNPCVGLIRLQDCVGNVGGLSGGQTG